MKIDVDVLDDNICENCPYLKIEQRYRVKWEDEDPVYYECSHLGMCEELKEIFHESRMDK